jgi:hypothetical protein
MSQDAVERFLGRLLTDNAFRRKAAKSLAAACSEQGYLLSGEELRAITREDLARFEAVSDQLDSRIKRFSRI